MQKNYIYRGGFYLVGLLVLALGISLNTKTYSYSGSSSSSPNSWKNLRSSFRLAS